MSPPWIVAFVALCAVVATLVVVVLALIRQVGVLHVRLRPAGAQPAGEGPVLGVRLPVALHTGAGTVPAGRPAALLFTSPTCAICAELAPSFAALVREYRDLDVHHVPHDGAHGPGDVLGGAAVFRALEVRSTPYAIVVDHDGSVAGKGIVNSLEQVEMLISRALGVQEPGSV